MGLPYTQGPPRAAVVVLYTDGYVAFSEALTDPPPGGLGGEIDGSGSYTIRDTLVSPAPTVPLRIGYVTDGNGAEQVVFEDVVQAVYRDNGVTRRDDALRQTYVLYTYCALLYAEVRQPDGSTAAVYRWAADPNFDTGQQPPYDGTAGTQGFDADYARWTGLPL